MMLVREAAELLNQFITERSPTRAVGSLDREFSSKLSSSARRSLLQSLSKFEERNLALQHFNELQEELFYSLGKGDKFAFAQGLMSFFPLTRHLFIKQIDSPQDFPQGFNLQQVLSQLYRKLAHKIIQQDSLDDWQVFITMVHVNSTNFGKPFMQALVRDSLSKAAREDSVLIVNDILNSYYALPRDKSSDYDFIAYDPSAGLRGEYDYHFDFGKSDIDKDPIVLTNEDLEVAYQAARNAENVNVMKIIAEFLTNKTPG